jgi:glucose/arabinose dehydrogenase
VNIRTLSSVAGLFVAYGIFSCFSAEPGKGFGLKVVAEAFVSPTGVASLPGHNTALLVSDQAGIMRIAKDGKTDAVFLDVRPNMVKLREGFDERGLLSFAFHPNYSENKKIYVVYSAPLRSSAPPGWDSTLRLSEFSVADDTMSASLESERVLLQIDKPYFNHNGGCIAFGSDKLLYMSVGDGGNGNDEDESGKPLGRPPEGNAQNLNTLLGKILRIDVRPGQGRGYTIPKDNPFVGSKARPEIYAYGMRNPWRISFDKEGAHELFAGDVGQDSFEEVDIIKKGGNYGWRLREGFHCFNPRDPTHAPADCPKVAPNGDPLLDPILEYKNFKAHPQDPGAKGISITGGYVYRGKSIPELQGKYIFADWSRLWVKAAGVLFAASKESDNKWNVETITPASHPDGVDFYIVGFGQDADGELYVLSNNSNELVGTTGKVYKFSPI